MLLRLRLEPRETLKLPAHNKGNTLRGAFGTSFRRLVCVPECRTARACPLAESCPYKLIFEPSPPQGADRLSKNQDIPRPFVFRPPLDSKTTYQPGETFEFELVLLGTAVNYLPYFVLAFREAINTGFGLNRARCELTEVRAAFCYPAPDAGNLIYSSTDQIFHQPDIPALADYVNARLALFPDTCNLSPGFRLFTHPSPLANGERAARSAEPGEGSGPQTLMVRFLTPTYLRAGGCVVREPDFHHLFKRLRDRLNALSAFYGPGPIDADFKALGELAEAVRTVKRDVHWIERHRTSSKTRERHELSGFIGSCVYDFSDVILPSSLGGGPHVSQSQISDQRALEILLPWLLAGELCHAGKHTAWGNGWINVTSVTEGSSEP